MLIFVEHKIDGWVEHNKTWQIFVFLLNPLFDKAVTYNKLLFLNYMKYYLVQLENIYFFGNDAPRSSGGKIF